MNDFENISPIDRRKLSDLNRKALIHARGRFAHFKSYTEHDPNQPEFSACFDWSAPFHVAMHDYFVAALKELDTVDLSGSEEGTIQVMHFNGVRLFRHGIEGFVKQGDSFVPSGIVQTVIYFAQRSDGAEANSFWHQVV